MGHEIIENPKHEEICRPSLSISFAFLFACIATCFFFVWLFFSTLENVTRFEASPYISYWFFATVVFASIISLSLYAIYRFEKRQSCSEKVLLVKKNLLVYLCLAWLLWRVLYSVFVFFADVKM